MGITHGKQKDSLTDNTVKKDNPMLDCRISGLEEYSPKRVIVAGNINFDEELKIFQTAKQNTGRIFN